MVAAYLERPGSSGAWPTPPQQRPDDIAIAVAGRCADQLFAGGPDNDSPSDLIQASYALAAIASAPGLPTWTPARP